MTRPSESPRDPTAAPQPVRDLHAGFHDPRRVPAAELERFLEDADRLPGIRAIQLAMRRAIHPRPEMHVLDAGCGIGLETTRLAVEYPRMHVTGLDRNADLLRIAARRRPQPANLHWHEADLAAANLPAASFDAIRTERVLMYLPTGVLERALDTLWRLLRPGGRLALFELDYGATILAPGPRGGRAARDVAEALCASIPQPLAGRRLPALLTARGLRDVAGAPFSFATSVPVWRRIVAATATAVAPTDPNIRAWLRERDAAAARGEFVAAFTGVLATATKEPVVP
jgi:SAM-dependent methyltransferase